jgi:hypothetical protein
MMAVVSQSVWPSEVSSLGDLSGFTDWLKDYQAQTAWNEAAIMYGKGGLVKPVVITDGIKDRKPEQVKLWGTIIFVPGLGPVVAAAALADSIVRSAAPVDTGRYKSRFAWYQNGQPINGPPTDISRLGARGNIELVDRVPYAAMVEEQRPSGVIYAAYNALRRAYGNQLRLAYKYGAPDDYDQEPAPGNRHYAVPRLTIGSPMSNMKTGGNRPGRNARRRARKAKQARRTH